MAVVGPRETLHKGDKFSLQSVETYHACPTGAFWFGATLGMWDALRASVRLVGTGVSCAVQMIPWVVGGGAVGFEDTWVVP